MFEKVFDRFTPVETLLREHFANLGVPDDLVVFEANQDAVAFRYMGQLSLRNTAHLIRESTQVCLYLFDVSTTSKLPQPQITFGRKERHSSMQEALDALTPHLNRMIRARKSFNFSSVIAVRALTPQDAWDRYREHVGTRDFTRAHSLLTGAAAGHYGKMQALKGASLIVQRFPDATGFEKDSGYSCFVDFRGELVPYLGENFEMGSLLFNNETTREARKNRGVEVIRIGQYWRIVYMPWNLGKRVLKY